MRYIPLALVLLVVGAAIAFAQPDRRSSKGPELDKAVDARAFVVTISEFRLTDSADPSFTSGDIVGAFQRLREEGTLDLVQSVRIAGVEREDSHAVFGGSVPVTTGASVDGNGVSTRSIEWRDVGTVVSVQGMSQADGMMMLSLRYESSGLDAGDTPDEMADRQDRLEVATTALIAPGRPALLGGTSADGSRYLLVTLEE